MAGDFLYFDDAQTKARPRTKRAGVLYDFLVSRPEGATVDEMKVVLGGVHHSTVNDALRALRVILGHDDNINVVCDPGGRRERWTYQLVGDVDSARTWTANRLMDAESRIETMANVARSIEAGTDGRTKDGRKATMMRSTLDYLREQLAHIDAE